MNSWLYEDENNIFKLQLRFLLFGVAVACIAMAFISLFRQISLEYFGNWLVFSCVITISINNGVRLIRYFAPNSATMPIWKRLLIFYCILLVATSFGVLLSYLIISLHYGKEALQWENIKGGLIVSFFVSLIVGTITFVNMMRTTQNKLQLQEQALQLAQLERLKTAAELASLQSRINPHFLYNALNAIAALIHDEPDIAEEMTINLSKLFRYSINTQNENYATIREELEILKAYFAIEKARFGEKLEFNIDIQNDLLAQKIPRFLLQPLVENSIKHGVSPLATKGFIEVKIEKNDKNQLLIIVHDNGVPFPEPVEKGFGIKSTIDKLRLLYGENNFEIKMQNSPKKQIKILLT